MPEQPSTSNPKPTPAGKATKSTKGPKDTKDAKPAPKPPVIRTPMPNTHDRIWKIMKM
ncbi:uncharacterized protein LOC135436513 [Drosophila montana]|uniref:uncharacterized protein LOC135436513 n=1 Tax=Drosophila montana TaxID=40370 RepID=UPI00313C1F81